MASEDISRSAFYASKRYRGVRMQQGRVLTDDDWNSEDDIASDDLRWTRVHVIGPAGSPDDGFKLSGAVSSGTEIDFTLAAGTYYVSGHRVTLADPIQFATQPDWLDMPLSERAAPTSDRSDFVYLEVWEQIVTAVEDEELIEKALGGPDTTTRRRLMARVKVLPGVLADDCEQAWTALGEALATENLGTLAETGELVPDLSLAVSYAESSAPDDLCTPSATAGYLGSENQAIKVQLSNGQVTWGYDNAAPPYRATIDAAGQVLTFLTQPRDAAHWPLAGQTVEVLRPSAEIVNGEVLADVKGHLTTLSASYDPTTLQVTLTAPHPEGAALAGLDHVYVRTWRRGTDLTSPASVPAVPSTPMVLGNTGVTVTIEGTDLRADAVWVIAVRPETPDQVVPWALETGRKPEAIRRFFAPIGMLHWSAGAGTATVEDCRPTFPPLTAQRGCCRYTVGDGTTSHGQFTRIQDAIDALPAGGGEICLLPGSWRENIVIDQRRHVTVHGCGVRSVVSALNPALPTVTVLSSAQVRLERFTVVNRESLGVLVTRDPTTKGAVPRGIAIHAVDFVARDRSALVVTAAFEFTLTESRVRVEALETDIGSGDAGAWPAVFLTVRDARVEQNHIETNVGTSPILRAHTHASAFGAGVPGRTALGGLQIAGQSRGVLVRDNRIVGGLGNGITLGSVQWSRAPTVGVAERLAALRLTASPSMSHGVASRYVAPTSAFAADERAVGVVDAASFGLIFIPPYVVTDCCPELTPDPRPPNDDDGTPLFPSSAGDLADIRIVDNDIFSMGANGIGVARFWSVADELFDLVHVDGISIVENRIHHCLRLEVSAAAGGGSINGWGGIALASSADLAIRDNQIHDNGALNADPSCGVFLLLTEHLTFERNALARNGRSLSEGDALKPGHRGGLVALLVESGVAESDAGATKLLRDDNRPAAKIADNQIASPDGPALAISAVGPLSVVSNHLATVGRHFVVASALAKVNGADPADLTTAFFTGQAVRLLDIGLATDLTEALSVHVDDDFVVTRFLSSGGVLFGHNQVRLDLRAAPASRVTSAVAITSFDDLCLEGNQVEIESAGSDGDAIATNLTAVAWTTRVTDNRFKEHLGSAVLSAATFGIMNTTTDNHGTHCFYVVGLPAARTAEPNHSFADILSGVCDRIDSLAGARSGLLAAAWSEAVGSLRSSASTPLRAVLALISALAGTPLASGGHIRTKVNTGPVTAREPRYTLGLLE